MQYINSYNSPVGNIFLSADNIGLTGLWFEGQKYFPEEYEEMNLPIFDEAKRWLDMYFSEKVPDFKLPLHCTGTEFQKEVWEILYSIPYGKTVTYGDIASELAKRKGIKRMSAQAVGGAAGKNKIAIIIPCHRVVGTRGNLTGYAGGMDKKISLLKLEKAYTSDMFVPDNKY